MKYKENATNMQKYCPYENQQKSTKTNDFGKEVPLGKSIKRNTNH
jgi:hypothetical protein